MLKSKRWIISIVTLTFFFSSFLAYSQDFLDVALDNLTEQINRYMVEQKKTKIAIIPFSNLQRQATTVLGSYLAEELTTNLFMTGKFKIVERSLLKQVLDELKLSQTGVVDPTSAKELGKMAGVDAIVAGTITDLGTYVAVNCRLIETETGEVFAAAKAKIRKDANVAKIMEQIIESPEVQSKIEPEIKDKPREVPREKVISFEDKISYVKKYNIKFIKVELNSIKIQKSGKIECTFLYTNLREEAYGISLHKPHENIYISDNFGNRYFCISSSGITESDRYQMSLILQPRVLARGTIIFPKLEKKANNINVVISYNIKSSRRFSRPEVVDLLFHNITLE